MPNMAMEDGSGTSRVPSTSTASQLSWYRSSASSAKKTKLSAAFKSNASANTEWEKGTQPAQWVRQDARTQGGAANKGTPAAGNRMQAALKAADKNADGKLSREEFPQPAIFKDVDQDSDGFATREEIQTYYASRRNQGTPEP